MDPHWIALAFGTVNSIRVVFYLPQIVAVTRSTTGARDIALSTWAMWALTNALGAAYGAVVVHDMLLAWSFALSLLACVLTMVLTVVQRLRWARGLRSHGPAPAVHSPAASRT
jgi:predicted MFS family arabinose efflux permease